MVHRHEELLQKLKEMCLQGKFSLHNGNMIWWEYSKREDIHYDERESVWRRIKEQISDVLKRYEYQLVGRALEDESIVALFKPTRTRNI